MPPLGTINNPKGRGKGTPNKVTQELRDRLKTLLTDSFETIVSDFKAMEPKDRVQAFERLLKYILPIMSANDVKLNFEDLTENQLDEIVNRLISNE